jgi:hypothetical protein
MTEKKTDTPGNTPREKLLLSTYQTLSQNEVNELLNSYLASLAHKLRYDRDNPAVGCTHKVSYKNGLSRAIYLIEGEIF